MNKKVIALLGACCLCFASANVETKEPTQSQKTYTLKQVTDEMVGMFNGLKKEFTKDNPKWVAEFKENYKNPNTISYGIANTFVEIYTNIFKDSKELLKEAKIKKEEAEKYVKEKIYKIIENL